MSLSIDQQAPDFSLPADDGSSFNLRSQLAAQPNTRILLVFYPADESPVCTAQLCEYRDEIDEFQGLNATIVGISAQNSESHVKFKQKRQLPFTLLSDIGLNVAKLYGAKGILGMKRATFLIDTNGVLRYQHVEATALFRRTAEELVTVLKRLDSDQNLA
jgi:thioredoxin-dependent peroxiredoxin